MDLVSPPPATSSSPLLTFVLLPPCAHVPSLPLLALPLHTHTRAARFRVVRALRVAHTRADAIMHHRADAPPPPRLPLPSPTTLCCVPTEEVKKYSSEE